MRFIVALLIASFLEFAPSNIVIPTLSRQSHKPLIHSRSITAGEQVKIEKLTLGLGIIRLELMTSTTSRFYMKKILFSMFYSILVGEEPDSVLLKKEGKQNQVKMV
ncbi:hypothetical protein MUK42_24245 [Musa troglodytarum]|uniref:Uncharacterized protein n=1 Tax=Musa troglodytarum TaxID=320322 RepID=A0A9E7EDR2_9LILI|nr:hypothetical protein MUK42_24245 [Musa troglodytarum]